jgi:toxin ParE1/3/4
VGKYRLTPKADADLDWIAEDTLSRWGKGQVAAYVDELEACFEQIADFPAMGMSCDDIRKGYRVFRIGAHRVYYRAEEGGVVIVRIRPQRMLPRRNMLNEERGEQ